MVGQGVERGMRLPKEGEAKNGKTRRIFPGSKANG